MDFHSKKRKELQALCKKHKIPANLSNQEMANKLTEFLKENSLIRWPIKEQDENVIETESADLAVNRKVKKVRFSPEHELIEFTRSLVMKRRSSRNSGLCRNASLLVVNVDSTEIGKQNLGGLGRITRSRGLNAMEAKENVKKRGRNVPKCGKNTNSAAIEISDNGKLKKRDVDCADGVMLLKEEISEVGDENASKRTKKRAKDDNKNVEKASEDVANEKPTKGVLYNSVRVTRSKVRKLTEVHANVEKKRREVATRVDNVAVVSAEIEENRGGDMGSFVNRGDVLGEGKLTRDSGERVKFNGKGKALENMNIAGECHAAEPQNFLRRSKRNAKMVTDSVMLKDTKKHENNGNIGLRKTSKLLALNDSGVNAETENEVNLGRRSVLKTEEAFKVEPRRSNRRKNVIIFDELKLETENRDTLRSSIPQLGITGKVSKDEKNDGQPSAVMRRLRHKALSANPVSADEEIGTGPAVENLEAETENRHIMRSSLPQLEIAGGASKEEKKVIQPSGMMRRSTRTALHLTVVPDNEKNDTESAVENLEEERNKSEPCLGEECPAVKNAIRRSRRIASKCKSPGVPVVIGGESIIHQKNKVMKRKRAAISGEDVIKSKNDPASFAETTKEGSSQKAVPGAATGNVADSTKQTCRLNDFKLFDASSHNGLESGDQFPTSAKPSASEGLGSTSNLVFSNTRPKNTSDVRLTSTKNTHIKKPDNSLADGAGIFNMKFMNEKEMDSLNRNAASRIKELKADLTDSEDQTSVNNIRVVENGCSLLEIDVHELIEQNTTDTDKNENDPEAHVFSQTEDLGCNGKIDHQVLTEDLNEGFDETGSSIDSLLIGDQIDNNADVEVAEAEADKCLRPCPCMVDNVDGTRKDNQVVQEDLNIPEKKAFTEIIASPDNILFGDHTDAKTDTEVAEVETDKFIQPNTTAVDHDGESIGTSAQKILDIDETRLNNQVPPEGPNVPGNLVLDEIFSSAGSPLLGDQADINTHLDLAEAEADKCSQPSPVVVEQAGGKNLGSDGIRQDSQFLTGGSSVPGKEGFPETCFIADREVVEAEEGICLPPNPSEVNQNSDEMKQESQVLPEGSNVSGNEGFAETNSYTERRPSLGDQTDIQTDLEMAEAEGDKCQQRTPRVVNHVSEVNPISVQKNLDSRETRQSNDITSPFSYHCIDENHVDASNDILENYNNNTSPKAGVFGALESSETHVDNSHSKCTLELEVPSSGMLKRLEVGNLAEGNGIFDNDVPSELAETNEDGNSNIQKGDKYCELSVPDLSNGERSATIGQQDRVVFSCEYSVMNSEEQGKYQHPLSVAPIINSAEINIMNDHETKHTLKRKETHDCLNLEGGKSVEGQKSKCEEDGVFSVSHLFDAEGMFHSPPTVAPTTVCDFASDLEAHLLAEGTEAYACSNKQSELIGSKGNGCFKSHKSPKDENWEINISHLFDGENWEINKEAWSNARETAGHTMCFLEANAKGNASQAVKRSSTNGDAIDARCGKKRDDFGGACVKDVEVATDCAISKIEVESLTDMKSRNTEETEQHQSENLLASVGEDPNDSDSIKSWTGIEPHNLATTLDNDTTYGLNYTSYQGTEVANHNLTMSTDKSISINRGSLTKEGKEIEGERSEHEKITNENLVLPSTLNEVSHIGFLVDREEFDGTVVSVMECFDTMKENVVTENKSDKKGQENGYDLEKSFCLEDPLSDSGEDVFHDRLNELDSVNGCESSNEQLTENTGECQKETNLITESDKEENIIHLGLSCLFDEAPDNDSGSTGKKNVNLSGSPKNLDKLEVCQEMLTDIDLSKRLSRESRFDHKSEGNITQSSETASESSISDLQKSNISEKSHHNTCSEDVSIFVEASIDTFTGPMDEKLSSIGCFDGQKEEEGKGTSPSHFLDASPDYDDVPERGDSIRDDDACETNIQDEKDCNLRSSQGEQENGDTKKSLEGTPDNENYGEEIEKTSTATMVQFSISQLYFEEKIEDFSNDVHTISQAPSSVCNDILKESDVADTIKEYIDSESSLPMVFKTSDPSLPIDEIAAFCKYSEYVANSGGGDGKKPLVDILDRKSEELDEKTPNIGSLESPACVDSLVEGIDVKLDPQKQIETEDSHRLSSPKELCFSTVKKNARAIIIHGTPGKIAAMADMKENAPTIKRSNDGDVTRVRPAKRRALQDVHWT